MCPDVYTHCVGDAQVCRNKSVWNCKHLLRNTIQKKRVGNLLSVKETMKLLRVGRTKLQEMKNDGQIPFTQYQKKLMFSRKGTCRHGLRSGAGHPTDSIHRLLRGAEHLTDSSHCLLSKAGHPTDPMHQSLSGAGHPTDSMHRTLSGAGHPTGSMHRPLCETGHPMVSRYRPLCGAGHPTGSN